MSSFKCYLESSDYWKIQSRARLIEWHRQHIINNTTDTVVLKSSLVRGICEYLVASVPVDEQQRILVSGKDCKEVVAHLVLRYISITAHSHNAENENNMVERNIKPDIDVDLKVNDISLASCTLNSPRKEGSSSPTLSPFVTDRRGGKRNNDRSPVKLTNPTDRCASPFSPKMNEISITGTACTDHIVILSPIISHVTSTLPKRIHRKWEPAVTKSDEDDFYHCEDSREEKEEDSSDSCHDSDDSEGNYEVLRLKPRGSSRSNLLVTTNNNSINNGISTNAADEKERFATEFEGGETEEDDGPHAGPFSSNPSPLPSPPPSPAPSISHSSRSSPCRSPVTRSQTSSLKHSTTSPAIVTAICSTRETPSGIYNKKTHTTLSSPLGKISIVTSSYECSMEEILHALNVTNLTSKKTIISTYRQGIDLYSKKKVNDLQNPQIDHIIEKQLLAYCILIAKIDVDINSSFYSNMRELINDYHNLNITEETLNNAKGHAFTAFIKQHRHLFSTSQGLQQQTLFSQGKKLIPLHCILYSDTMGKKRSIGKYTHEVICAIKDAMEVMLTKIRELACDNNDRDDVYERLADRLDDIIDCMAINDYFDNRAKKTIKT